MQIEVMLMDNVKKLGKAGEIVKVAPGYARNYLFTKGRAILVEGRLQMDSWEKDGVKHQKLKVRASTIKFLPQGDRLAGGPKAAEPVAVSVPESDPDDIPF